MPQPHGGIRYDWYGTDDEPAENADFLADYGFSNAANLDGEGLLQPRFAFTLRHSDALTVRGGAGLYTGGNPNVWLSNTYSANNVLQFGQRGRAFGYTDGSRSLFDDNVIYAGLEEDVPAGPGDGIPSELYDAVAGGTGDNFEISYLDPEFDLPAEWKFALGASLHTHNGSQPIFYTPSARIRPSSDAAIWKGSAPLRPATRFMTLFVSPVLC